MTFSVDSEVGVQEEKEGEIESIRKKVSKCYIKLKPINFPNVLVYTLFLYFGT
jgi:hypothetical protein